MEKNLFFSVEFCLSIPVPGYVGGGVNEKRKIVRL